MSLGPKQPAHLSATFAVVDFPVLGSVILMVRPQSGFVGAPGPALLREPIIPTEIATMWSVSARLSPQAPEPPSGV